MDDDDKLSHSIDSVWKRGLESVLHLRGHITLALTRVQIYSGKKTWYKPFERFEQSASRPTEGVESSQTHSKHSRGLIDRSSHSSNPAGASLLIFASNGLVKFAVTVTKIWIIYVRTMEMLSRILNVVQLTYELATLGMTLKISGSWSTRRCVFVIDPYEVNV